MATSTVLALLLAALTAAAVGQIADRERLYRALLFQSQYHPVVPPIGDVPLNVTISFSLNYVTPLSDSKVEVDGWIVLEWTDPRLVWDTADFPVDSIRLPQEAIWTPDVVPYNNLDVRQPSQEKFLAAVSSSGDVMVVNKATLRLPCAGHSGERACQVKFGSWTYNGFQINLFNRTSEMDLTYFIPEKDYTVTDTSVRHDVTRYPCCPEPYPSVTFNFTLKKNRGWFS